MAGILGVEEHEQPAYDLVAGKTFETKKITISSGAGKLVRGTVLGMDRVSCKYKQLNPSASDGTHVAWAILAEDVDATNSDVKTIAYFLGKYRLSGLIWPPSITDQEKKAALRQLQTKGIIVDEDWS
ncbi:Bacteriophage lambda head decoration protein D [Desulfonauticus submarinus]|uniref:Bacteriophage lambda head decoration protein D n=1 Tax=Desulfonauticus submarinus TaxID=206665 RepID=A0A1H0GAT3_9BACT|nr:head decoration protein [Desulfonauticus submarinus]SDO03997.1 Bacteriophage lambda head decoration protein D [Desulfonauticus submarinus]